MSAEEVFRAQVKWLYDNIPPDDIYDFAQQTLMAAEFFMSQWGNYVDLTEVYHNDSVSKIWIRNIVALRMLREGKIDGKIDTNMRQNEDYP